MIAILSQPAYNEDFQRGYGTGFYYGGDGEGCGCGVRYYGELDGPGWGGGVIFWYSQYRNERTWAMLQS